MSSRQPRTPPLPAKSVCNSALAVVSLLILQACAASSDGRPGDTTAASVSKENLDLLFATEYPVASKEEALAKADLAFRDGELDKTQFYLVKAVTFDPQDADLLARIADLHVVQGNQKLAVRAYRLALKSEPQHARSLEGMGLLYFHADNVNQAREMLELAIASAPNLWRSYNTLGVLADGRKDYALAQYYYDEALAIHPESDSVLMNRGYSRYLAGKYHDAALDLYEAASRSDHPKAWRNLAMVYGKQGWYEDALETYRRVMDEANACNETGVIAMNNGDYREAKHYLTEAIRLSPRYYVQAENNLAELQKRAGTKSFN